MSQVDHPFLRFELLKFQINSQKQWIDLKDLQIRVEIKNKSDSTQSIRVKRPAYNERNGNIRFDAGLFENIQRQISIQIHFNEILYKFESDLKYLQKIADGYRHQISFTPKAQADIIIEYKSPLSTNSTEIQIKMHGKRYAERYQNIQKHFGHRFVPKIFKSPKACSRCDKILWGFTYVGFQCQRCYHVVHQHCIQQIDRPCQGKNHSSFEFRQEHQFEQEPFSLRTIFCDHDGSFIRPGHVYKCKECLMIIHRRCQDKVGHFCGLEQHYLESYEQWKLNHKDDDFDYNYQYNGDLCEMYTKMKENERSKQFEEDIERLSKVYKPLTTPGFHLNQFEFLRKLGQGMSAKVYLVKQNQNYYAMKVFLKHILLEGQNVNYLRSERNILKISHSNPFIVQLFYVCQNAQRVFFLMEIARAGSLYDLLEIQAPKHFKQERIIFYVGQVTSALLFLHSKNIVYRDLKPENVFVFEDGNLKLGDFGLSKENIDENHKTSTICGTSEYMAYEIYNKQSYDQSVDWWALGILIFELSTFQTPFYAENSYLVTQNVLRNEIKYPEFMHRDTKSIVAALLEKDTNLRLGNPRSPHGLIQNQPFFKEPYSFEAIQTCSIPPPWIPTFLLSTRPSRSRPQLSEIDQKDALLLLSTPQNTFTNFSYINPDIS